MKPRGFTLIELLVVIAIIAILAAILFPVFAQAKQAAKGTQSLSNAKELGTAVLMYSTDFDDFMPLAAAWNPTNPAFYYSATPGQGLDVAPWDYLIAPYCKNGDLLVDPLAPAQPAVSGWSTLAINLLQPQFGYNFQGLSPFEPEVVGSGVVANQVPRTVTALHSSSGFVMLASKFAISAVDKSSWWTAGGGNPVLGTGLWGHDLSGSLTPYTDNGPMSTTIVGAPDCGDVPDVCADSWGMEDPSNPYDAAYNSQFPPGQPGIVEGVNTGGVSRRREDEMTMVFCDTHAKALRPGYAAIGTTYSDYTLRANTHVTDKTQYMWEDF